MAIIRVAKTCSMFNIFERQRCGERQLIGIDLQQFLVEWSRNSKVGRFAYDGFFILFWLQYGQIVYITKVGRIDRCGVHFTTVEKCPTSLT